MDIKTITLVFYLGTAILSSGQIDDLNKKDFQGKKHGKWMVYLDKDWKKTEDSSKAYFMRYTYFDHGSNIYPMGKCGGKNYKLESAKVNDSKIKLLDGEYKWYNGKGVLSSVHVLKNGEYVSCTEYYESGKINQ